MKAPKPPSSRSDNGLTTLEWLLIVAAVAGLAALAVVLVQNVVDETAEEISGNNARVTAARVAAARITSDARATLPDAQGTDSGSKAAANETRKMTDSEFESKCNRLKITYSDADVESKWWKAKPGDAGTLSSESSAPDNDLTKQGNKAALCEVAVSAG